jgi:hypothetical protein
LFDIENMKRVKNKRFFIASQAMMEALFNMFPK